MLTATMITIWWIFVIASLPLGSTISAQVVSELTTQFTPLCSKHIPKTLVIRRLDWQVQQTTKHLMKRQLVRTSKILGTNSSSCLIIGLNLDPDVICQSCSRYTLESRTTLLVEYDEHLKNCSGLDLNTNIFGFNQGGHLFEIFGINEKTVEINKLRDTKQSRESIWQRRSDLKGQNLRVRVKHFPPWIFADKEDDKPKGILIDMMDDLRKQYNFSIAYFKTATNETWDESVGKIGNEEFAIGLSTFGVYERRTKIIDYGRPFFYNKNVKFLYGQASNSISWKTFFIPMEWESWIVLAGYLFVMTGVFMVTYIIAYGWVNKHLEDSLGMVLVTMISKRVRSEPNHASGKILLLTCLLTGYIFLTMYKTMLAAILAVEVSRPPVKNLEDIPGSSVKVYVLNGAGLHTEYKTAPKDNIFGKIYDNGNLATFENTAELEDGRLQDNLLNNDLELLEPLNGCNLKAIHGPILYNDRALIFPKGSIFRNFLDFHVKRHKEWMRAKHRNWERRQREDHDVKARAHQSLSMGHCASTFAFLLIGLVLSSFIYLIEVRIRN